MASTSVKVAVRVRPLTAKEVLDNALMCISYVQGVPQLVIGGNSDSPIIIHGHPSVPKSFTFDFVFDTASSQELLYGTAVKSLVQRFLEGIVQKSIADVFTYLQEQSSKNPRGFKYTVTVSFLELYNEELFDLLNPHTPGGQNGWGGLNIRENGEGQIVWSGVREEEVNSPEDAIKCLQKGTLCRTTASTDMNASSSRSHAIFTFSLRLQRWKPHISENSENSLESLEDADPLTYPNGSWVQCYSKFHFVDLAGSERLKRTNAAGERKKEGISINQGLLALGNVISALGDESRKSSFVPYRDSKLTRMLQDSLGGNSQTLMLACVSPSDSNYGETMNTLTYANRARNIKNNVVINQEWLSGNKDDSTENQHEIRTLRAQVSELTHRLETLKNAMAINSPVTVMDKNEDKENTEKYRTEIVNNERKLQQAYERQRELQSAVDLYVKKESIMEFEIERLRFRCCRLYARACELSKELETAIVERDNALLQKISKEKPPSTKSYFQISPVTSPKRAWYPETENRSHPDIFNLNKMSSPDEWMDIENSDNESSKDESGAKDILNTYVSSISEMRFRLANAEDKLEWYHEVVSHIDKLQNRFSRDIRRQSINFSKNEVSEKSSTQHIIDVLRSGQLKDLITDNSNENTEFATWSSLEKFPKNFKAKALGIADRTKMNFEDKKDEFNLNVLSKPEHTSIHNVMNSYNVSSDQIHEREFIKILKDTKSMDLSMEEYSFNENLDSLSRRKSGRKSWRTSLTSNKSESEKVISSDLSPDLYYMLVHKLQTDIANQEELMKRLHNRDMEYENMKQGYDQKLISLQEELARAQKERDTAIRRISVGKPGSRASTNLSESSTEKPGSVSLRARHDEKLRKLQNEIEEHKRKIEEYRNLERTSKERNEALMKNLQSTVQLLKAEKLTLTKQLKAEATRRKDLESKTNVEILKLKRQEKAASEISKKLEHSHKIQRSVIRRRSEDILSTQNKLRIMMNLLRRASTGRSLQRVAKSGFHATRPHHRFQRKQLASGIHSPIPSGPDGNPEAQVTNPTKKRPLTVRFSQHIDLATPLGDRSSPFAVDLTEFDDDPLLSSPSSNIRSQFKKQMLDKEIYNCIKAKQYHQAISSLKESRTRILGEQQELLLERQKCLEAQGSIGIDQPQYMDQRLLDIDGEVALINARIIDLWRKMQDSGLVGIDKTSRDFKGDDEILLYAEKASSESDLSWENCVNLLRSLNTSEIEFVGEMFIGDIIDLRMNIHELETKKIDGEQKVGELRLALDKVRNAALQAAMDYEKKIKIIEDESSRRVSEIKMFAVSSNQHSGTESPSSLILPSDISLGISPMTFSQSLLDSNLEQRFSIVPVSVEDMQNGLKKIRNRMSQHPSIVAELREGESEITLGPEQELNTNENFLESRNRASVNYASVQRSFSSSINRRPASPLERFSSHQDHPRRSMSAGRSSPHKEDLDVFLRLSSQHTMSSQAKVIPREFADGF
ncbi:Kinesin-like protein kif21b [Nowakowskiella sp. JEL0078]|nr:Kinesin-like protein kif21b [Nowakowskiella sp. JEL0078]